MPTRRFLLAAVVAATTGFACSAFAQENSIVVASTTSTQDSGLFGYLLALVKAKTGIDVEVFYPNANDPAAAGGAWRKWSALDYRALAPATNPRWVETAGLLA